MYIYNVVQHAKRYNLQYWQMNNDKKISPQAIMALKDALPVIFWKKEDLHDFIKLTLDNSAIVSTIN